MSKSGFWRLSQLENHFPGAIEWSRLGRKPASHDAQWTCRCSPNMPIPVSQGDAATSMDQEDDYRCLERVSQCANPRRRSPSHHVHHAMGSVPIKTCPRGYSVSQDVYTRRFDEIVNDLPNKTKCIDETCVWADRYSRRELLSNMSLARRLRSTRNFSESRKVCVWLRRRGICWFRHHSDRCPPMTNISAQSVTFLRHKTSLTSDLDLASSTKYRTATPFATTKRLPASI